MYDIQKGDLITTINGDILKVRRVSERWVSGLNITKDRYFMSNRTELEKIIKEVVYL